MVFGRPSTIIPSTAAAPKVQLRTQNTRHVSRPISMPLERLPTPAHISERSNQNTAANFDIPEVSEPEKSCHSGSSRVSTYYIRPFIDTQTMQRRTWDRKYKHYDVTPRTAMIVAKLPSASSGLQPVKATAAVAGTAATTTSVVPIVHSVSTIFANNPYTVSVKPVWSSKRDNDTDNAVSEPSSSPNFPLTLRAPRTLQPPPGTFYRPPVSMSAGARTLANWTTTVTTTTVAPPAPAPAVTPALTSPPQTQLQTQDSTDSAIDPGASTSASLSPPQSPPPSSPDDLSPSETKPVYQRLRPRRLQELEHREAHFV